MSLLTLLRPLAWLCLALFALAGPAAYAEDCWRVDNNFAGNLQRYDTSSLTSTCYAAPSDAIAAVTALYKAASGFGQKTPLQGHLYWNDDLHAVHLGTTQECPTVVSAPGALEYCALSFTSYHQSPDGTLSATPSADGWFLYYVIQCPPGTRLNFGNNRCEAVSIVALQGASRTKARPAGPALPMKATVTRGGYPREGISVTVDRGAGGPLSGATDSNGEFAFTYVPPLYTQRIDLLSATCAECFNTAQTSVTVEAADLPASCPRDPGALLADPISPMTGANLQSHTDWQDSAPHGLSVVRRYNSLEPRALGSFGGNWSLDGLAELDASDTQATVRLSDGSKTSFSRQNTASAWLSAGGIDSLTQTNTGTTFQRGADETTWQFDTARNLVRVAQRNGWTQTLGYDGAGRLVSMTNAFGRVLQLSYTAAGRIGAITAPDGTTISYTQDAQGRLVGVTWPGGATRSYQYQDSHWPNGLTGVVDEGGALYASFSYDAQGRALSAQNAGGALAYTLNYPQGGAGDDSRLIAGSAVDPALFRTTVQASDPLGNAQGYTFQGGDGHVAAGRHGGL